MKIYEVGEARSMYGEMIDAYSVVVGKLVERANLEDLGIYGSKR